MDKLFDLETVEECYCDADVGAGYTFSDEYGPCPVCEQGFVYICQHCVDHIEPRWIYPSGEFANQCEWCHESIEEYLMASCTYCEEIFRVADGVHNSLGELFCSNRCKNDTT